MVLHLNKFESLHPRMLCGTFGLICSSGTWEENFKFCKCIFCYFVIFSPWKRAGLFIWTNLNPLHPRMLCAKFGWNLPSGSEEEDENVKSLRQQRGRRQRRWTFFFIRKAHLSLRLRWDKKLKAQAHSIGRCKEDWKCNLYLVIRRKTLCVRC